MSNIIDDNGNAIQGTAREVGKCAITFKGAQNRLTFGKGVTIENATIAFSGSNGSLQIDDNAKVIGMFNIGDGCHIRIGKETKFNKPCRFITQEGAGISIGSRCLLANVKFRTSDSHSIIDVVSGQRINPAKEIVIGNNVWIAEDVKVYKGAAVGDGSIIGAGSILTSKIPSQSLAVGIPAKVVKSGVTWQTERLPMTAQTAVSHNRVHPITRSLVSLQQGPKNIATFGSSLARQVANNYAQLFDGKVISSVCHNRSDYFCKQLLQQRAEPEHLNTLLQRPLPDELINLDKEDNVQQTLRNQAMATVGMHRLSKGVNFFQAVESGVIDLLIVDNSFDLTARLSSRPDFPDEAFYIRASDLDVIAKGEKWQQNELLTPGMSAENMSKLLDFVHQASPKTLIVFIQSTPAANVTTAAYQVAYQTAFKEGVCQLIPPINDDDSMSRQALTPLQLHSAYAGMIKGIELVSS